METCKKSSCWSVSAECPRLVFSGLNLCEWVSVPCAFRQTRFWLWLWFCSGLIWTQNVCVWRFRVTDPSLEALLEEIQLVWMERLNKGRKRGLLESGLSHPPTVFVWAPKTPSWKSEPPQEAVIISQCGHLSTADTSSNSWCTVTHRIDFLQQWRRFSSFLCWEMILLMLTTVNERKVK